MDKTRSLSDQSDVIELFERLGALETGHFVYTSGKHGEAYVAKDLVFPSTRAVEDLAEMIAEEVSGDQIDTVIGIAPVGAILASYVADWITEVSERPTYAIFAEKEPFIDKEPGMVAGRANSVLKTRLFVRGGLQKFIDPQQRVLIVEDVLNTGGSAKKLVELVRCLGGEDIWGVADLWNRGGVTAEDLGVDNLFSLCDRQYPAWDAAECPLCAKNDPVRTDLGHGKQFLEAQGKS